jgi:hypothetical protein
MYGRALGIHILAYSSKKGMDGWDKPGHDGKLKMKFQFE